MRPGWNCCVNGFRRCGERRRVPGDSTPPWRAVPTTSGDSPYAISYEIRAMESGETGTVRAVNVVGKGSPDDGNPEFVGDDTCMALRRWWAGHRPPGSRTRVARPHTLGAPGASVETVGEKCPDSTRGSPRRTLAGPVYRLAACRVSIGSRDSSVQIAWNGLAAGRGKSRWAVQPERGPGRRVSHPSRACPLSRLEAIEPSQR